MDLASAPLVLGSGLLAGLLHVVSGVDHLAALLPLAVGRRLAAFGTGVRWGFGHSAGVLVVGLLGVALKQRLDLAAVGLAGERLVGAALVVIGALGIRRALRMRLHTHSHAHDGAAHTHLHVHLGARAAEHDLDALAHRHGHAAFAAGTLHGVAGSAHLLAVVPAVALPGWLASGAYLLAFALGTVLAMGAFAALVGEGSARAASGPRAMRGILLAAGAVTVIVGVAWLFLALRSSLPHEGRTAAPPAGWTLPAAPSGAASML